MPRRAETKLTDTAVKNLRPRATRYEVRDAARAGFGVQRELKRRIFLEFAAARGRVAQALIDGACASGMPGQAAMQRTFWQLSGELKDGIELSGPNCGPVALSSEDYQRAEAELAEKLARRPDVLAEVARLAGVSVSE